MKSRDDTSLLSAFFKHPQVNMSVRVPLVLLARHSCGTCSTIFMKYSGTYSRRCSQFSAGIFDLKSQCTTAAWRSWSRNNVASFHHAVPRWKSPVHPLSDSGCQWATPGLQRYIEVLQIICQPRRPMTTATSLRHVSTILLINAPFVVDMTENVSCHQSVLARRRLPTQPLLIPYHYLNASWWGRRGRDDPLVLWHLVSTISPATRWDLWNGSHTCTWDLLKPPVKATWP